MEKLIWNNSFFLRIVYVLISGVFLFSGCASLEKARSLHLKGQNQEALMMAQEFLDDDEDEVRLEAVNLIGEIDGNSAGKILMPMLIDPAPVVKNAAIKNMGKLKYAPASEKLINIALETKGDTFEVATVAIRKIGSSAIDLLVKKYSENTNPVHRDNYKRVMLGVGPSVATGITKNLAGKSFFENRTNFELLIAFKSPAVAAWMLKDIENEEVADMIVEGLAKLGNRATNPVMEKLRELVGKPRNELIKERLITVLGNLKSQRAIGLLEELTKDDSDRVREAADFALKKVRGF